MKIVRRWTIHDLPPLRSGDLFLVRDRSWGSRIVRWLFTRGLPAPMHNGVYSHGGWIAWPVKDKVPESTGEPLDVGVAGIRGERIRFAEYVVDYAVIESIAKGVSPGSLVEFYGDQEIAILRTDATDAQARKAVGRALAYGRRRYDWLIGWAILRKVGPWDFAVMLCRLLCNKHVGIPHVRDSRPVCLELLQEPYQDIGVPLVGEDLLLEPSIYATGSWHVLFRGPPHD